MPIESTSSTRSFGIAFLVAAGFMLEATAAYCSSPQTTEINASKRAGTLMKWVNIGTGVGAGFVVVAAACDPQNRTAILSGGVLSGVSMYGAYVLAKRWGLNSSEQGTESY